MADTLRVETPEQRATPTATAWLVVQAMQLLNTPGEEAEAAYQHVIELLGERDDRTEAVVSLVRAAPVEDTSLRWSALYVAGDIGDGQMGEYLLRQALEGLPEHKEGCEGPADGELLIRTMAVEALGRIAKRHPEARESIVTLIGERPNQAVLIEAVKVARSVDLDLDYREMLGKGNRWILDICTEPVDRVVADPERIDDAVPTREAPALDAVTLSPRAECRPKGD